MSRLIPLLLFVVALLAGCGGGGGGGGNTNRGLVSVFVYGATGSGPSPSGTQARFSVYQVGDTTPLKQQTIALTTASEPIQLDLSGLPMRKLHLHGDLLDAGSNVVGTLDRYVDTTSPFTFSMALGQNPAGIEVTSPVNSVNRSASAQLYANAFDGDNRLLFLAPTNVVTWSSSDTGVATVISSGLVTGIAGGSTQITASLGSLTGNYTLNVPSAARGKWTIMVFINAANSLYSYALPNIDQMESIAPSGNDVRFVVQWKQTTASGVSPYVNFSGTRRYLVRPNNQRNVLASTRVDDGNMGTVDMGSAESVHDFLLWAKANYPADRYALVVWDHGNGWRPLRARTLKTRGVSFDEETGNYIDTWQLGDMLQDEHVDLLAFDACNMQMLEVAGEVKDKADYLAASEELTPGPGYPYHLSFKAFVDTPDASIPTLAQGIVSGFTSYYTASFWPYAATQSVLDLSKLDAFMSSMNSFSTALTSNANVVGPVTTNVRSSAFLYARQDGYTYVDAGEIAALYKNTNAIPNQVALAAQSVETALGELVIANGTNGKTYPNNPHDVTTSTGIALEFMRSGLFSSYSTDYLRLQSAVPSGWGSFLSNTTANP